MEQEVIIFWAVGNGYLDDVEVENIKQYEEELLEHFESTQKDIYKQIVKDQKLDDQLIAKIKKAVESFTKKFVAKQK